MKAHEKASAKVFGRPGRDGARHRFSASPATLRARARGLPDRTKKHTHTHAANTKTTECFGGCGSAFWAVEFQDVPHVVCVCVFSFWDLCTAEHRGAN